MSERYIKTELGYVLNPNTDKFTEVIYSREHKGLNTIISIVGARGIGKTYEAMKIAETLSRKLHDYTFVVDDVVFSMKEFLIRLKYHEEQGNKYVWLVFDETGLEVPAREFMKLINKIMSYVAQSFRHTKVNLIVVVPHDTMVDIHIQLLADFKIVMKGRGKARVYKSEMNPFRAEPRTPLFCELETGLPSKELYEAYEQKRSEYLKAKYEQYMSEVEHEEQRRMPVESLGKKDTILAEIKKDYLEGRISKEHLAFEIQRRLGTGHTNSYDIRNQLLSEIEFEKAKEEQQKTE
jgi:hypothetical protein